MPFRHALLIRILFCFLRKNAISHVMGYEKVRKNIFVFSRNKEISDQQGMRKGYASVKNR